jgi:hypothetical protein
MSETEKELQCVKELRAIARIFMDYGETKRAEEVLALADQIERRLNSKQKLGPLDRKRTHRRVG